MSTPTPTAPVSVRNAMTAIWSIVVLRVVSTVLQFTMPEQFQLADEAASVTGPTPMAVSILSAMFSFGLIAIFILFALSFQRGARWARTTLLILALLFLAFSLFGVLNIVTGAEVSMVATLINVVNLLLLAALVNYLVKPDTAEWCQR